MTPLSAVLERTDTTGSGTTRAGRAARGGWWSVLPPLLAGLIPLGVLFRGEIVAAVRVWAGSSAYNHCFIVPLIAAYIAWDRRAAIAAQPVAPLPWATVAAVAPALAWLIAERLGIMEGRQLAAVGLLQVLCLAVLGWRLYAAMSAALLYLFFLVPFGAFITPLLQDVTTWSVTTGLDLVGIPYAADDNVIEIPQGIFQVAEACAGLRFLIASVAFGVLYAVVMYRGPWRRLAFIAVSAVVPVVANGFRALGIVVLGNILGSARAAAADHVLYGWIFFSIVLLILAAAGMPFRDVAATDAAETVAVGAAGSRGQTARGAWIAAALLGLVAAAGPLAAAMLDARAAASAPRPVTPVLHTPSACTDLAADPDAAIPDPRGGTAVGWTTSCGAIRIRIRVLTLPPTISPGALAAARDQAIGPPGAEEPDLSVLRLEGAEPPVWTLVTTRDPDRMATATLYIGGRPSGLGLRARVRQARAAVAGGSVVPPVIVSVVAEATTGPLAAVWSAARAAVTRLLQAQPDLSRQIAEQARAGG